MPRKAQALVVGTLVAGFGSLVVAVLEAPLSLRTLALFGAAVVLTELIQVQGNDNATDPVDAHGFSFSSGIHIAAVLVIGPWAAALVAAFGVLVVDTLRRVPLTRNAYNASVFALATLAGGLTFEVLGGSPGALELPSELVAILGLVLMYTGVNTVLVVAIVAFNRSMPFAPVFGDAVRAELSVASAEAGLGLALAFFALANPWGIVALVPLVFAVYLSHARLAQMRRETARALETLANIVDERDPYTFRHSARVSEYVRVLADKLGLPPSVVARLSWAGRLHDLGKITVDASVLRKPGMLNDQERAAMLRHPRLSARLLRPFRFAAEEARAVEYHHERFDGGGYYRIDPLEIPLAAHFLIVSDSYDAMTTDRPYRPGLTPEQALPEIEAHLGSQFHPVVGKAFLAVQRGLDPLSVLSREEQRQLGRLAARRKLTLPVLSAAFWQRPEVYVFGGLLASLGLIGAGRPWLALFGLAPLALGLAWRWAETIRARRLASSLESLADGSGSPEALFQQVVEHLSTVCDLTWAGVLSWRQDRLAGSMSFERNTGQAPTLVALTSWLAREAEAEGDCIVANGAELGRRGRYLALRLGSGDVVTNYLVLGFERSLPGHVELGVRACHGALAGRFAASAPARRTLAVAS